MVAILKYASRESASTIVVINGLAITAGSNPRRFAPTGSMQPISIAMSTALISVRQMVRATGIARRSKTRSFTKLAAASVSPQKIATLTSFQMTPGTSEYSISPSESPRMTVTDACPPAFQPVSISIGI